MITRSELPIASPCHVDFASMTRKDAMRRFCGDCKKHVHDLTRMTEAEAKELLATREAASLCVRYLADDRGQVVFLPDVPSSQLNPRKRARLATLAAAAVVAAVAPGCSTTPMMMGDIAGPPGTAAYEGPQTSWEIARGETRVSILSVRGTFRIDDGAAAASIASPVVSGVCQGDAAGCGEVKAMVEGATTPAELVDQLQRAGFVVVQRMERAAI